MEKFLMNVEYYYELFQINSLFLKILYTLVFILSCLCAYNILFLIKKHFKRRKTQRRVAYLRREYFERIKEILLTEQVFSSSEFHNYLGVSSYDNGFKRELTNLILEIIDTYPQVNKKNYELLLEELKLKKFWEEELLNGSKKRKERALRKIKGLNLVIAESVIIPMTTIKNSILRRKARSLYIYISKNNPFRFFDNDFDDQFSEWDNIEIHEILSKKPQETIPNFIHWVQNHSAGEALKSFLVYEMGCYGQKEASPYLLKMIESSGMKLRQQIIRTLGVLQYKEAATFLMGIYPVQPSFIQEEILKTLGEFAQEDSLPFVENAVVTTHNVETKMQGLYTLLCFGESGKAIFERLKARAKPQELLAFEHVENPLNQRTL